MKKITENIASGIRALIIIIAALAIGIILVIVIRMLGVK